MIHKQIFEVPSGGASDIKTSGVVDEVEAFLSPFGFVRSSELTLRHTESGLYLQLRGVYSNSFAFRTSFKINSNNWTTPPYVIEEKIFYHKQENVDEGSGLFQVIAGEENGVLWFTFCSYNKLDIIKSGWVTLILDGDTVINTSNGNMHQGNTDTIGVIKPIMMPYDAFPNHTHVSDAYLTDGNFLIRDIPKMKGYASTDIQPHSIYSINNKQYLALPNRLLVET